MPISGVVARGDGIGAAAEFKSELVSRCLLHLRGGDAGRVGLMRSVHVHSPPSRLHGYMHCDVGLLV